MNTSGRRPDDLESAFEDRAQGRLQAAIDNCERVLQVYPEHLEALKLLTLARSEAGDHAGALQAASKLAGIAPNDPNALNVRGIAAKRAGEFADARACFQAALKQAPGHLDAALNLGHLHLSHGDVGAGLAVFEAALEQRPDHVPLQIARATALVRHGQPEAAVAVCDQVLQLQPDNAEALRGRAIAMAATHRAGETLKACAAALDVRPDDAVLYRLRGTALHQRGQAEEAEASLRKALALEPRDVAAYVQLAKVLNAQHRPEEAVSLLAARHEAIPNVPALDYQLGLALYNSGRLEGAVQAFDSARTYSPDNAEIHFAIARAMRDLGKTREARAAFDEAVRLQPNSARYRISRGFLLRQLSLLAEARRDAEEAIRLAPEAADGWSLRARLNAALCRFAAARADHLKALSLRPDAPQLRSPYLYALNYMPDVNERTITLEHKTWGERHGRPGGAYTAWDVDPDPKRTLRIGLVSADFGRHPVGYLLAGVLEALDPRQLAVVGYSGRAKEDEVTARLRAGTTAWRRTIGLGDRKLAEAIRADRIDILIDLAGHTEGNRLTCFALRPAPVQATWIGYCGTTGVPAIDYILMDKVHVPRGSERWFTERVVRLPGGHWCYSPPADAPAVVPPPCLDAGHVTFGSFNSPIKINDDVLAVWAEVLAVVPKARLLLCWPSYQDPLQRGRILDELRHCGVDPGQVELIPGLPHKGLLEAYGRIDVALDTFPFSGGITSCEALWMGVPLITWPENRPVSRQTLGQLRAIGRTEWVAGDAEDYIRKAVDLAGDPTRLAALRTEQRSRMAASRLCNARAFAGDLQIALRTIWRDWCLNAPSAATRAPPTHRDGAGDEQA